MCDSIHRAARQRRRSGVDRHRRRSFDNALAETTIGLYKTECVGHDGPWRGVGDLELATLDWVWWFNNTRLHSALGYVPPIEFETQYHHHNNPQDQPIPGEPALY